MLQATLATKPSKTLVQDKVREIIVAQIIPLLLENQDDFYKGNGENLTLGQDSFFCNLTNEDGSSAGRVMFAWSPNIWGPKAAKDSKSKANGQPSDDRITLVAKEFQALDAAIATMKANGDVDGAVKLNTIKAVAQQSGNKVTRDDYRVVFSLMQ